MLPESLVNWRNRALNLGLSYRVIGVIIALSLTVTVTEIFGIGIFLPIFQFIRLNGDLQSLVSESTLWEYIIVLFNFFNVDPSFVLLLLISFSFFLFRQLFMYIKLVYNVAVRQRISKTLRDKTFNRYIDADTSYHDSVPVGNLVNVITTEVNSAVMGVMAPMDLVAYIMILLGYLSMLFLLSWQMTLLSIVVLLFASRMPNIWIKKSANTGRKLVNANNLMSEFLVGRLRSPRLVRLAGTAKAEKNEFHKLTQEQRKYAVHSSILQAKTEVVMDPIVVGLSLVFLYFAYTSLQLQIEVIGLYLVIALRLLPVVKGIITQWQTVQRYLGSIEIIENRLESMSKSFEHDTGTKSIKKLNHSIEFDNVDYHYLSSSVNTLKGITIKLKANEMTALVGPSGSGKSTLVDLLPRLRLSTKGLVSIDGVSIEKYTLKSLRKIIAYSPQTPQIFNGTVKNHILYGKKNATDKEVLEAARLSGAEGFINLLPEKFDTILGEDAVNLSGGQRQRLDLARALVKKAPILILDEPTSNLDAESEEMFKQALSDIYKEKNTTIIIIAHRLASISAADRIVVLNHGKVEAAGSHLELLRNRSGWYAKAWKIQSQG
jgi:ABC-type multidrug transport system fused ATPase/permease subunit